MLHIQIKNIYLQSIMFDPPKLSQLLALGLVESMEYLQMMLKTSNSEIICVKIPIGFG